MDHFGPGIEYLDIHSDDDQFVNLTCFTEKVVRGDGKRLLPVLLADANII